MITSMRHRVHYSERQLDDPCDDWSGRPIPKKDTDRTKRINKRNTWWQ